MNKEDLIMNNINLIYYVMKKMGVYHEFEEYYDSGLVGLVKAANMFDPTKGYRFSTFAIPCIRNQICHDLRRVNKCVPTCSLDAIIIEEDNVTLSDLIPDDYDMEDRVVENEKIELLRKAISTLKERDQELLKSYYFSEGRVTQSQLAEMFDISQAHVSRKLITIIAKLKKKVKYDYERRIY